MYFSLLRNIIWAVSSIFWFSFLRSFSPLIFRCNSIKKGLFSYDFIKMRFYSVCTDHIRRKCQQSCLNIDKHFHPVENCVILVILKILWVLQMYVIFNKALQVCNNKLSLLHNTPFLQESDKGSQIMKFNHEFPFEKRRSLKIRAHFLRGPFLPEAIICK